MKFDDIMKMPYADGNPNPTGEVIRNRINDCVKKGRTGTVILHVLSNLAFRLPEHEIETEDLASLVDTDETEVLCYNKWDEEETPKTERSVKTISWHA